MMKLRKGHPSIDQWTKLIIALTALITALTQLLPILPYRPTSPQPQPQLPQVEINAIDPTRSIAIK